MSFEFNYPVNNPAVDFATDRMIATMHYCSDIARNADKMESFTAIMNTLDKAMDKITDCLNETNGDHENHMRYSVSFAYYQRPDGDMIKAIDFLQHPMGIISGTNKLCSISLIERPVNALENIEKVFDIKLPDDFNECLNVITDAVRAIDELDTK